MKKIAFSDKYGLTQAVLEGRKTMTRRIIKGDYENIGVFFADGHHIVGYNGNIMGSSAIELHPLYQVGEKVAVAQRYKDTDVLSFNAYDNVGAYHLDGLKRHKEMLSSPGYRNKMFVKAEYMPYRIRITNIKVERLQYISDDDCMREGLLAGKQEPKMYGYKLPKGTVLSFLTPRDAFAALIDRISGKGTWERNPWVYAYSFELVKEEEQ